MRGFEPGEVPGPFRPPAGQTHGEHQVVMLPRAPGAVAAACKPMLPASLIALKRLLAAAVADLFVARSDHRCCTRASIPQHFIIRITRRSNPRRATERNLKQDLVS
jgi:hypothetical protein